MARGTQLVQLVTMLREETKQSSSVAGGTDALPALKRALRKAQTQLYQNYDWPFMRIRPTKALSAGQRYYDLPTDLNLERIEKVMVWWNGQPQHVDRGIDVEHFAVVDSDSDERSDPVLRWDVISTAGAGEQLEVWPIPATNYTKGLQFVGLRKLRPLIADSDVADMDDDLIVLFAAASILSGGKDGRATRKANEATALLNALKGRVKTGSRNANLARRPPSGRSQGLVIRVRG